jgi:uridine kinase
MEKLGQDTVDKQNQRVVCISQESFYRELRGSEREEAFKGNYNFDHPDALDNDLIQRIIMDILHGKEVQIPIYDFASMR